MTERFSNRNMMSGSSACTESASASSFRAMTANKDNTALLLIKDNTFVLSVFVVLALALISLSSAIIIISSALVIISVLALILIVVRLINEYRLNRVLAS